MAEEKSWPIGLQRLAVIIGPKAAMQLAEHFGGVQNQYIPRRARLDHPFTALIGLDRMEQLCEALGTQRIDIPKGTYSKLKKAHIIGQRGSAREIALRVGCSMRYVKHLRSQLVDLPEEKPEEPDQLDPQADLFSAPEKKPHD